MPLILTVPVLRVFRAVPVPPGEGESYPEMFTALGMIGADQAQAQGFFELGAKPRLDVVQADLNQGLTAFADDQFDVVILSRTLQAVVDVKRVLDEMLRVGRRGIVSFPNIAYRESRAELAEEGRAPQGFGSERASWFDTPNLRFLSIADFEEFCSLHKIRIHQRIALETRSGRTIDDDPNLNADLAIFVISR